MKKRRLFVPLVLLSSLTLTGCDFLDEAKKILPWIDNDTKEEEQKKEDTPSEPSGGEEGDPPGEDNPPEPKVLSGEDIEAFYASFDYEVVVPEYKAYAENAYFDVDDSYTDYGLYYVNVEYSTSEELETYANKLDEAGWEVEGDGGDYYCTYNGNENIQAMLFDYTNPEDLDDDEEPSVYLSFIAYEEEDDKHHLVLESAENVQEKDDGTIHQVMVDGYKFDLVGYEKDGGTFGTIKKGTFGKYEYNGMVYNRSLIDNLESIKVRYNGGKLYYKFTEYLMEDMNFDGANLLESGKKYTIPEGHPYFVLYTLGDDPVYIYKIDIARDPEGNEDYKMIFDKNYESTMGGARSNAKSYDLQDSFIEIENNPTESTNNYSVGKSDGHSKNDTWYRWNGRYFAKSENLGTDFTFSITIMGDYARMIDEDKFFHYNVWPQFAYENCFIEEGGEEEKSNTYAQTYIGNDNYEPLGKENALHQDDPYVEQSYTGRFFTDYSFVSAGYWNIWINDSGTDLKEGPEVKHFESEQAAKDYITEHSLDPENYEPYEDGDYEFLDPDTSYIEDGKTTFRQAYDAYNLPFWKIDFHVYLDENKASQPVCETSINGYKLYTYEIFEHYDMDAKKDIYIYTMPMHLVNYGIDAEGHVDDSCTYKGSFTYPRIVE